MMDFGDRDWLNDADFQEKIAYDCWNENFDLVEPDESDEIGYLEVHDYDVEDWDYFKYIIDFEIVKDNGNSIVIKGTVGDLDKLMDEENIKGVIEL